MSISAPLSTTTKNRLRYQQEAFELEIGQPYCYFLMRTKQRLRIETCRSLTRITNVQVLI
jgi:hypothetical protein